MKVVQVGNKYYIARKEYYFLWHYVWTYAEVVGGSVSHWWSTMYAENATAFNTSYAAVEARDKIKEHENKKNNFDRPKVVG